MAADGKTTEREAAWQNRVALAALLRTGIEAESPMPEVADWPALIALAADEQLTPTLAALPFWSARSAHIPEPVRDYFDAALFLNAEREQAMAEALARAMAALAPMEPVALKGAANLIGHLYKAPGARLMGDLDILVADPARAAACLAESGFAASDEPPRPWIRLRHHHAPMRHDRSTGAGVELHDRLETIGDPVILAPEIVRKRAAVHDFAGRPARIPSPTDRLVHAVAHDQISDRGALSGRIAMRLILEVALLARSEEVDWEAARSAFPPGKWRDAFIRVAALAHAWFDAPVPACFQREAEAATLWLRRRRSRPARALAIAAHRAAGLLRTQPLALVNLLNPAWTKARIRAFLR
ncbi:MAG TPA: nucleotidyltransferase family protein [Allosphingosinicella sp.]|jgi:hypothetical protein|nr:nucleotidyltransferase family protein [Allosphingosinicella sp.]